MSLRATNLNLLPILRALLEQASVTRAAATLGLSQPATSNALGRLRALFADPLLVPAGRAMRLTPRAEQLRPMVGGICEAMEALLLDAAFVPARANRDFVVATPDYMALLLGPTVLRRLSETAPGVSVRFADIGTDFRHRLAAGDVDLAIIARVRDAVRGFHCHGGYVDRLVGVVAADHPLAAAPPATDDALDAYPRLGIEAVPQGLRVPRQMAELMASDHGQLRTSVSHLLILPLLAAQTRGVAVLPEMLARQAAKMVAIAQFELPGPAQPLDLCLMWSPALDSEPAQRWFRSEMDAAMRVHFHFSPKT